MNEFSPGVETSIACPTKVNHRPWYHYRNWLWVVMFAVIIGGLIYPLLGLAVAICFVGAIITAIFWGRRWCGNYCPRGNFWDRIVIKMIREPQMPAWAKNSTVRVAVLVVLMTVMTIQLIFAWEDWEAVGRVFVILLTITTVMGVLMALTGHQRAWCKVCPAGTIASWLSKCKPPQLKLDELACKNCGICKRVCPMGLDPTIMGAGSFPTDPDCLKCNTCVEKCPAKALKLE
ncbi:MAG: 4Fe-4S binding protein [Candidatus Zipacnadales bacterium]